MDSPSPFTRAERTFWTFWTYITEVVGRYLRPEATNTVANETRPEQEAIAARQTDNNGGDEENVIKTTMVSPEHVSEVGQLEPDAWEQCNVIIGTGIVRENVQYTGTPSRGNDCEGEEQKQQIHINTTQNYTNKELNEGQEVKLELFTDIQILCNKASSESSMIQAGNGQTASYYSSEERISAGSVGIQEEEEFPVESTKIFHFVDDGNKTEDQKVNRDEEQHFDNPNLTSVCAEPAKPLDKNNVNEHTDREIIQDLQSAETMGIFSEKEGEEETAVVIDTEKERWKEEIVEFSEEEVNIEDLCITKYQISHGKGDMNIGRDIEDPSSMTGREAIQEIAIRDHGKNRDIEPYNDFNIFKNKGERCDNSLRFQATENLDQVTDPKPQLLCGGFSDEDRKLGQDIFAPEPALQLQMACDNKKGSVPNDEITVVRDEQRLECNIERSESIVFKKRQDIPEDEGTKYRKISKIEDVVDTGTMKDTEEVIDKVMGTNAFCDQEKNVEAENKLEEINISKEEKGTGNVKTLVSMGEFVRDNNTREIRGGEKSVSLGLCEEPVVAQEPKHVACEGIREEIPENNNGKELKEDTVPEILEVSDDEQVNTTHLQEHIESDNKESGISLNSDPSPVSELLEVREVPETVEELFEVEEVENTSNTVIEDYTVQEAAKSQGETERTVFELLNETENNIQEDLVKTEAKSGEPMDIEVGLLEEAADTDASLSDKTQRTESGLSGETEFLKAQFGEGWMESKTARTIFEKETRVEIPEVKTELEPTDDSNETVAGSVRESLKVDLEILKEEVDGRIQKEVEVDATVVRTEPELYSGLLVSEKTLETQSESVKEDEAEIQGLRTNNVPPEKTVNREENKLDELIDQESVFFTQPMDLSPNDSLETIHELSDKKAGTKSQGIDLPDLMEKGIDLLEENVSGQVVRSEDMAAEGKYPMKTIVMENLMEPWAERETHTEEELSKTGLQKDKAFKRQMTEEAPSKETDIREFVKSEVEDLVEMDVELVRTVAILPEEVRPKIDWSKETNETGYVPSEVTFQSEVRFSEEMNANLAETKYGSQDDLEKDIPNARTESVVSKETVEDKSGLSDELLVSKAVMQVKTNARLMENLNKPETGLSIEIETDKSESSERITSEFGLTKEIVEVVLSGEPETDPEVFNKYPEETTLLTLPDAVLPHGSVDTESILSEKNNHDSSDESLGTEARSLKISEAGIFEKSVDCESGLEKTDTEISDVEKEPGLSEKLITVEESNVSEKEHGLSEESITVEESNLTDTEFVKNTEAVLKIKLEPELSGESTETEDQLVGKTKEKTAKKLPEIQVGFSWETNENEAPVTEEVVETRAQKKPTDFRPQVLLQEAEVGRLEEKAGVSDENTWDDAKAGTENVYPNITLQFEATDLDFTAQKDRIALKNPQVRPPKDPRTLLNMPSLTPTPSNPVVHVPVKGPMGMPMGGMGGIGIKMPGLGAGFPVLRKTVKGVRDENNIPEKSELEPEVRDKSSRKEETQNDQEERKSKWTPPRLPGFGNPLMMNELKNKLKKTTKEKVDD